MRLKRLEVADFRSVRSAEADLVRVNWILGDNGEGKTSMLMALRATLLAQASKYVVNAESKSARLNLIVQAGPRDLDLGMTRFRSKVCTPTVNGRSMPRGEYVKAMPELLGVTEKVLEAVLDSGQFMSADAKTQASLIINAAGVTHEWADAEAAFKTWCEDQKIEHFELTSLLKPVRLSGLALIDAIKSDAYGQRTLANKQAALEQQAAPEPPPEILQYVRNEGQAFELLEESKTLRDRLPRLQQQLSWLAQIEDEEDPSVELDGIDRADLTRRADLVRTRRAALRLADAAVSAAADERDRTAKTHKALASAHCPFGVKCDFKEWAPKEWGAIVEAKDAAAATLQGAINAEAALPRVDRDEISALQAERARITSLERRRDVRAEVLKRVAGVDHAALRLEADQVTGRRDVVTTLLDTLAAHKKAVDKHAEAVFRRDKAVLLAGQLDTIVKGFEKPIRYKMVDAVLEQFVTPMTEALRLFIGDGFTFKASASDGFDLSIEKKGLALPFAEISESEKLMVSTAAQHAIAQMAGAEILVIDAVDTLRGATLNRFIMGLYALAKGYRTVVVASTTGKITPEKSPLRSRERFPDTQLMVIRDGVLEILPQLSADEMRALK